MNAPLTVVCRDVVVCFDDVTALSLPSLTIERGETVALVGQSGAGKSTLLNVLAGLVPPDGGDVSVLGSDLRALRGRAARRHRAQVGLVSQLLGLAPSLPVLHTVNGGRLGEWSVAAALASLVHARGRDDVVAALARVGLADRVDARTGDLSGGEQQRVAVARTLLQAPRLVLADEPTSSVDPDLADRVMAELCGVAEQTVVVSMHDPELARRHVDRVVGLRDGTVVFDESASVVTDAMLAGLYQRNG